MFECAEDGCDSVAHGVTHRQPVKISLRILNQEDLKDVAMISMKVQSFSVRLILMSVAI